MTGHHYNALFPRAGKLARSKMGKAHIGVLRKARIQGYSAGGLVSRH